MSNRAIVPPEDHREIADLYVSDLDNTLESLGDRYGVSRERMRQIIKKERPDAQERRAELAAERDLAELEARFEEACQYAIDNDRKCVVCYGWIIREGEAKITCSHECAQAWVQIRDFPEVDGGKHRESCARSIIGNPDGYSQGMLEWAEGVLSGENTLPNRRWLVPGSRRSEALKKYRPEIYRQIVNAQ